MERLRKLGWDFWACIALCLFAHLPLVSQGLALHDSDQWIYPLASSYLGSIETPWAFPFEQQYGGLAYSWLRPIFAWFFHQGEFWRAQALFSYSVTPILLFLSFRYLLMSAFQGGAVIAVCAVVAAGLPFVAHVMGIDFYPAFLMLACILLGLRFRRPDLLKAGTWRELFIAGVLSGFSIYLFRASLIFVFVLFFPWEVLPQFFKQWSRSIAFWEKWSFRVFLLLMVLFLFLFLQGSTIGHWNGKTIKVHAIPNLKFALLIFGCVFLMKHARLFIPEKRSKAWGLILGVLLGSLPEIFYRIGGHRKVFDWTPTSDEQRAETLGNFVRAMREIWFGYDTNRAPLLGVLDHVSFSAWGAIGILAIAALLVHGFKNPRFYAPIATLFLGIIAYFSVHASSPGPTRYLFPLLPGMLLGIGVLFEITNRSKLLRLSLSLVLLLGIHHIVSSKWEWAAIARKNGEQEKILSFYKHFEGKFGNAPTPLFIVSDDYWKAGLKHTVGSNGKLLFYPLQHPWNPPSVLTRFDEAETVGVVLTRLGEKEEDPKFIERRNRRIELFPLGREGDYRIYRGRFVKSVQIPNESISKSGGG